LAITFDVRTQIRRTDMLQPRKMIRFITPSTGRDLLGIALALPFATCAYAQFNPPGDFKDQKDFNLVTENINRWGDITASVKSNVGGIPYTGIVFIDDSSGLLIPFWLTGGHRAYDSARSSSGDLLVVGARTDYGNSPAVWVLKQDGISWCKHAVTDELQKRIDVLFKDESGSDLQYFSSVVADDYNEQWLMIGNGIVKEVAGPVTVRIPYSLVPDDVELSGPRSSDDRRQSVGALCVGDDDIEFGLGEVWDLELAIPTSGEPSVDFWVSGSASHATGPILTNGLATIDGLTDTSITMPVQNHFLITPSEESNTLWYCEDWDPGTVIYCRGYDALPDGASCGLMRWHAEGNAEEDRAWYSSGDSRTVTDVLPWLDNASMNATAMRATEFLNAGQIETRIVGLDRVESLDEISEPLQPKRMENTSSLIRRVWSTDRAVEWKRGPDAPGFTAHDLNDRVKNAPLRSANGINEQHDIIGMAYDNDAAVGFYGYLLTDADVLVNLDQLALAPAPAPCTGDFNGDGTVNGADFGLLLAEWGEAPFTRKDLNCDGKVNGSDVGLLLAAWGDCPDDSDG
ncbi:MAG: dockerin type I repeat-containing protein, partial [Phycisphaerales bacterium]